MNSKFKLFLLLVVFLSIIGCASQSKVASADLKAIHNCTTATSDADKLRYCARLNSEKYKNLYGATVGYKRFTDVYNLDDPNEMLILASYWVNRKKMQQALDDGADVNFIYPANRLHDGLAPEVEITPLSILLSSAIYPEATKLLLENGADPNLKYVYEPNLKKKFNLSQLGSSNLENFETARLLVEYGYEITENDLVQIKRRAAMCCNRNNEKDLYEFLLSKANKKTIAGAKDFERKSDIMREKRAEESEKRRREQHRYMEKVRADMSKQMSNEKNIGKKICRDGTLHYKISHGITVMGKPYLEDRSTSGQLIGFLEGFSPDGSKIQFRVSGYATQSQMTTGLATYPRLGDFLSEPGIIYWDDGSNWYLCGN